MMQWLFALAVAACFIGVPWFVVWKLESYLRRRALRRLMADMKRDLERMADEIATALVPALRECIATLGRFAEAWNRGSA